MYVHRHHGVQRPVGGVHHPDQTTRLRSPRDLLRGLGLSPAAPIERRLAKLRGLVAAEPDDKNLQKELAQAEKAADGPGNPGHQLHMEDPVGDMVIVDQAEDLGLVDIAGIGPRVENAVGVEGKLLAIARPVFILAPDRLPARGRGRRQSALLVGIEGVQTGKKGCGFAVVRHAAGQVKEKMMRASAEARQYTWVGEKCPRRQPLPGRWGRSVDGGGP